MVARIRDVQNQRLLQFVSRRELRAIITVSDSSRADIENVLGTLECPIAVVPNFIPSRFKRILDDARATVRKRAPFILAVGVFSPTKNIPMLCSAFRFARERDPAGVPERLLLVGRRGWARGIPRDRDIEMLGHVEDMQLARLYATSSAFVFPSLFEGFGMPVLEALTAGAKVLCSDIPVFREIAGDLVHYARADDATELGKAIVRRVARAGPPEDEVRRRLSIYTPTSVGQRLRDTYRLALKSG
jgi:glycosyltransferase involved in cell wall biosynthesis